MIITEKEDIVTEREYIKEIICDISGKKCTPDDFIEYQETFSFVQHCGYGSVFGDGETVRVDICQEYMYKLLKYKNEVKNLLDRLGGFVQATYVGLDGDLKTRENANKVFEKGKKYDIEYLKLDRYWGTIKLVDIDGEWNSVLFDYKISNISCENGLTKLIKNFRIKNGK